MAGTKVSLIPMFRIIVIHKNKLANRFIRSCQVPYTTFFLELQRDSDEEEIIMKQGAKIVFPFQAGASFSRFIIKNWNTEAVEDVKRVLSSLEKDTLLLDLIPIAFDDDLDIQAQINGLFTEKDSALSTIWDFILISFRFYGEPVGLHKCLYDMFLRLDGYYLEHATLLIEDYENIIGICRYCINKNENLLRSRNIEQSKQDDSSDHPYMDVVMEETIVPRALSAQESTSLVELILSPAKIQMSTWKPIAQNIMRQ